MGNEKDVNKKKESWLQLVTEQSWEPELLISGLAIYATIQLPDLLLDAFRYYQYNLQAGTGFLDETLPVMIYGILTTITYLLSIAFITHFVVRAFWVGLIGLQSVYPDGIAYDKLPYSDFYKQQAKEKLGSADDLALDVDRVASMIFSIAFGIVLIFISTSLVYTLFFLLYNISKLFLSPAVFETYSTILFWLFVGLCFLYVIAIYLNNMKRFRSNPKIARWHFNLSWKTSAFVMPLLYRPVQFISLTFLSNTSSRRFAVFVGVLFTFTFSVMISVMLDVEDLSLVNSRDYYATRSSVGTFNPHQYGSLMEKGTYLREPVIEEPVLDSRLLSVFIPYPKLLDEKLTTFCGESAVPDTLASHRERALLNRERIACGEQFFSFSIDDTISVNGDLLFAEYPGTEQAGFRAQLMLPDLAIGKHELQISRPPVDPKDEERRKQERPLIFESRIPFWVEGKQ